MKTDQPDPAANIPDFGAAQTAAAANLSAVAVVPGPATVAVVPAPVGHLEAQCSSPIQSEHSADFFFPPQPPSSLLLRFSKIILIIEP